MDSSTRGIVLHKLKYSDTSLIVKIYTEAFGLQSYIVQGGRGKKSKSKATLFQPLALLEMEVHHREKSELQRIRDAKPLHPFASVPYHMGKSSIAMFITEVLYKSIRTSSPDAALFEFVAGAVIWLDLSEGPIANFHLLFLLRLSQHLGFYPQGSYSRKTPVFDLVEGEFRSELPLHQLYLTAPESEALWQLLNSSFEQLAEVKISSAVRKKLLQGLVDFYRVHIEGLSEIKSHRVLETIAGA